MSTKRAFLFDKKWFSSNSFDFHWRMYRYHRKNKSFGVRVEQCYRSTRVDDISIIDDKMSRSLICDNLKSEFLHLVVRTHVDIHHEALFFFVEFGLIKTINRSFFRLMSVSFRRHLTNRFRPGFKSRVGSRFETVLTFGVICPVRVFFVSRSHDVL